MFFSSLGIVYAFAIPCVYFYRHHKGKCPVASESDVSVTAAMVWPVTLFVDYVYGI